MTSNSIARRVWATVLVLYVLGLTNIASAAGPSTRDARDARPSWGAIASKQGWYGYAFNQATRSAAEQAARAQCDRAAGRSGPCDVKAHFERSCGALATGNYGEWGTGNGATASAAGRSAIAQCESHLPTEPCKLVVNVCSLPG